jgi:UDP-2,4-diacetamido-2,4,6-trideoxy-beta-L-altropyranose hydrolase
MRIGIRADASPAIGIGHIMRCLKLATALQQERHSVTMLCARITPELVHAIQEAGVALQMLAHTDDTICIESQRYDVVIADHYTLNDSWFETAATATERLVVIDDTERAHRHADIYVNPNQSTLNMGQAPADSIRCIGPRFALIATGLAPKSTYAHTPKHILCCMGGSDPDHSLHHCVEAAGTFPDTQFHIVAGNANPHADMLAKASTAHPNIRYYRHVDDLPTLLIRMDAAIVAGGGLMRECLSLGVPCAVVSNHPNQSGFVQQLAAETMLQYIGPGSTVSATKIDAVLQALHSNYAQWKEAAMRAVQQFDGRGITRLSRMIQHAPIQLRDARMADAETIYAWRTHERVRASSHNRASFGMASHMEWMEKTIANPNSYFWLAVQHAAPVGVFRADMDDQSHALLSIYLNPDYMGLQLGPAILQAAVKKLRLLPHPPARLIAQVNAGNDASHRLFAMLGFTASSDDSYVKELV